MAGVCLVPILFLALFGFHSAYGTSCGCPALLDSSDKSYCCPAWSDDYHCCTAKGYYESIAFGMGIILVPILILICIIGCVCTACRSILRGCGTKSTGPV